MDYRKLLNDRQYEAVTTSSPYVRVIAGAGSGKTRVLTYRIAYLIGEMHIAPQKILAITFTNKVAKEMKERASQLVPEASMSLRVSTFHSFCARFLREEITPALGYPVHFTIFDEDDQEALIKSIAVELGYKKSDEIVKLSISYIGTNKTYGRYPEDITIVKPNFPQEKECLHFFSVYEEKLRAMYAIDFDDLLLKTIQILTDFPDVRSKWQHRIDHVLIDEFQDTNDVQYRLLKLILKPSATLYVVGDPDQTIYTWRGANQNIILDMDKNYAIETIILDRNYRSTQMILNTANKLIDHNRLRVKKDLYTENAGGAEVVTHRALRADDEAEWVVREIQRLRYNKKFKYSDVAILYRASYLTLPFENAFNRYRIPYKVFGGVRFYQRTEIKDVLAYFHLLSNIKDDVSFERVINIPRRGIGEKTVEILKSEAHAANLSIYEYLREVENHGTEMKTKCVVALTDMIGKIDKCREKLTSDLEAFSEVLKQFIIDLGYFDYLADDEDKGDFRIDNVNALFDDILSYIKDNPQSGFEEYLQNVALTSSQDDLNDGEYVSLMTVHTAKGLEFANVFVVGLNEGVFPSERTLSENAYMGLEEERRLCYVALTRAKEKLYLSCNGEYSYVIQSRKVPSRFFKEAGIDFDRGQQMRYGPQETPTSRTPSMANAMANNGIVDWAPGDQINHKVFGPGTVIAVIDNTIIDVDFPSVGRKKLMSSHPAITRVEKNTGGMS